MPISRKKKSAKVNKSATAIGSLTGKKLSKKVKRTIIAAATLAATGALLGSGALYLKGNHRQIKETNHSNQEPKLKEEKQPNVETPAPRLSPEQKNQARKRGEDAAKRMLQKWIGAKQSNPPPQEESIPPAGESFSDYSMYD